MGEEEGRRKKEGGRKKGRRNRGREGRKEPGREGINPGNLKLQKECSSSFNLCSRGSPCWPKLYEPLSQAFPSVRGFTSADAG